MNVRSRARTVRTALIAGVFAVGALSLSGFAEEAPPIVNDPMYSQQWYLPQIGMPQVWSQQLTRLTQTRVAVLSTGIDWTHRDLLGNIYANSGEAGDASYNGIDDDGNGRIDDYRGWNFAQGGWDTLDRLGRGTHIAGVIGAVGNNNQGIAGMAWRASILPVKITDDAGVGSVTAAIEGLAYARSLGARVIVLDLETVTASPELEAAITEAIAAGAVIVVPAGDAGKSLDEEPKFPASLSIPGLITVAGTARTGLLHTTSNFGFGSVTVAAPGVEIRTTLLRGAYGPVSSSAVAAAQVAGLSAILMERNPTWTPAQISTRIQDSSVPSRQLYRTVGSSGNVSAINAINGVVPPRLDPPNELWVDEAQFFESPHPYPINFSQELSISVPGARIMRVVFKKIETERRYDQIRLFGRGARDPFETLDGSMSNYISEYVIGDEIRLNFTTDNSGNYYGFAIERVQVIR